MICLSSASINFTTTARPVMFNLRDGVSLGIFAPQATFKTGQAVVLAIWVSNSTDDERELESCSDVQWWTLALDVYDSQWQRKQTTSEKQSGVPAYREMGVCGRNIALRVPPHSCGALGDNGRDVTVDLSARYDLPTGTYFVTQKQLALPLRGLPITIVDTQTADRGGSSSVVQK
jgi:hypothetical protein